MPAPRTQKDDVLLLRSLHILTAQKQYGAYFSPAAYFLRETPFMESIARLAGTLDSQTHKDLCLWRTAPLPCAVFSSPLWQSVCGPDWAGHPFRHEPLFWSKKALEPDITRMIRKMCSPADSGDGAVTRAKTFLKALRAALPGNPNLPFSLEDCGKIIVEDEVEAKVDCLKADGEKKSKKRIDLIFSRDRKKCITIEVKFDATPDNDLKLYKKYIIDKYHKDSLFVILGRKDNFDKIQKNGWLFAHWLDVMRYWEDLLSKEMDEKHCVDFSRLRATIWKKL